MVIGQKSKQNKVWDRVCHLVGTLCIKPLFLLPLDWILQHSDDYVKSCSREPKSANTVDKNAMLHGLKNQFRVLPSKFKEHHVRNRGRLWT